jgi:hypothetical protein
VRPVNDTGAKRAARTALEVMHGDEGEWALKFVEADLLPAGELVSASDDENGPGERTQPAAGLGAHFYAGAREQAATCLPIR